LLPVGFFGTSLLRRHYIKQQTIFISSRTFNMAHRRGQQWPSLNL
jgi:hypothetical protein